MWNLFWLPPDVTVIDRPALLALHTRRPLTHLNSVYRTRATADELPALVGEVGKLHARVDSRWLVIDTVETSELEHQLGRSGYVPDHIHDARITAVDRFVPRAASAVTVCRVTDARGLRDWWHVSNAAFERRGVLTDADITLALRQCAAADARVQRFVAYIDDEPVSSGGINLYPELAFGFLWAGGTVASARGKGAYSALVAARVACAAAHGGQFVGLYARVGTSSPIVASQGFDNVGRMAYWHRTRT